MRPNEKELYIQTRIRQQKWLDGKNYNSGEIKYVDWRRIENKSDSDEIKYVDSKNDIKSDSDEIKFGIKAGVEYDILRKKGREDIINSTFFSRDIMTKLRNENTELDGKNRIIKHKWNDLEQYYIDLRTNLMRNFPIRHLNDYNTIVSIDVPRLLEKTYLRLADKYDLLDQLKLLKIKKEMVKSILSRDDIDSKKYEKQLGDIDKIIKIYGNALEWLNKNEFDMEMLDNNNRDYYWNLVRDLYNNKNYDKRFFSYISNSVLDVINFSEIESYKSLDLLKDELNEKIDSFPNPSIKNLIEKLFELIETKHELRYQENRFKYKDSLLLGTYNQILKVLGPGNFESLNDNDKSVIFNLLNRHDNSNGSEIAKLKNQVESLINQFNIIKDEITRNSDSKYKSLIDYVEGVKKCFLELNDLKIEHYDLEKKKLFAAHEQELMQFQDNKINDNLEAFLKNEGYSTSPIRYVMDDIFKCCDFKVEYLKQPQTNFIRNKINQLDNCIEQCKNDIQLFIDEMPAYMENNEENQHTFILKSIPEDLSKQILEGLEVEMGSITDSYIDFKREDNINRDIFIIRKLQSLLSINDKKYASEFYKRLLKINESDFILNNSFTTKKDVEEKTDDALRQIRISLKGAYLNNYKSKLLQKDLQVLSFIVENGNLYDLPRHKKRDYFQKLYRQTSINRNEAEECIKSLDYSYGEHRTQEKNIELKNDFESKIFELNDYSIQCKQNANDVIRYMFDNYPMKMTELINGISRDINVNAYRSEPLYHYVREYINDLPSRYTKGNDANTNKRHKVNSSTFTNNKVNEPAEKNLSGTSSINPAININGLKQSATRVSKNFTNDVTYNTNNRGNIINPRPYFAGTSNTNQGTKDNTSIFTNSKGNGPAEGNSFSTSGQNYSNGQNYIGSFRFFRGNINNPRPYFAGPSNTNQGIIDNTSTFTNNKVKEPAEENRNNYNSHFLCGNNIEALQFFKLKKNSTSEKNNHKTMNKQTNPGQSSAGPISTIPPTFSQRPTQVGVYNATPYSTINTQQGQNLSYNQNNQNNQGNTNLPLSKTPDNNTNNYLNNNFKQGPNRFV